MYIQSERLPLLVYKTISYKNYRAVPSKPIRSRTQTCEHLIDHELLLLWIVYCILFVFPLTTLLVLLSHDWMS